jgi:hypothetical protein
VLTILPMSLLDVRRDWSWVRNGLLEVIGRCKERWSPEDCWTAVQSGNAFVWRVEGAGDDLGFMILRRDMDPDGPVLFVWALWTEPGALDKKRGDLFERLRELAHRMGAKRIRMESSRKGWQGLDFFEPVKTIFEAEV